ncbi:hypothetical protein [Streptomyces sp. NPDC003393]
MARSQGLFNLVGGGWPLLHLRSFEWVFGAESEQWLQQTTAGLLATAGSSMLLGPATTDSRQYAGSAKSPGTRTASRPARSSQYAVSRSHSSFGR